MFFGSCANTNKCEHDDELLEFVKGTPNVDNGNVMDLKARAILKVHELEKLGLENLNLAVKFMEVEIPRTENMAVGMKLKIG